MNRATTLKRQSTVTLAAVCVLLLSSCYRVESNVIVENDGSGQVGYVMAFSYDAFEELDAAEGATREEFCDDIISDQGDIPESATVEPYDEDGYCGLRVTISVPANSDFNQTLADLSGDTPNELQELQIDKIADDQWTFALSLENSELSDLDSTEPSNSDEQAQLDIIDDTLQISYHIELPGNPGDNNADSVDTSGGKTLFDWRITTASEISTLEAATTPESGNSGGGGSSSTAAPATTTPPTNQSGGSDTTTTQAVPGTEEPSDTTGVNELGFSDDGSAAGPIDGAPDTGSRSTSVLIAGLLAILAVLGGIVLLVLKWPSKATPAGASAGIDGGIGHARQVENPPANSFAANSFAASPNAARPPTGESFEQAPQFDHAAPPESFGQVPQFGQAAPPESFGQAPQFGQAAPTADSFNQAPPSAGGAPQFGQTPPPGDGNPAITPPTFGRPESTPPINQADHPTRPTEAADFEQFNESPTWGDDSFGSNPPHH